MQPSVHWKILSCGLSSSRHMGHPLLSPLCLALGLSVAELNLLLLFMSSSSLLSWACSLASCSLVQQDRHDVQVAVEGGKLQCSRALVLGVDVNAVLVWAARCNT